MEERVKRLERSIRINRMLIVGILLFLAMVGGVKVKEFFTGRGWLISKGVVTEDLTTQRFTVMEPNAPQPKPRVLLYAMDSGTSLSFVDATRNGMLGIGIRKDSRLGEIPYISFQTKAGAQILEPNEEGKVDWVPKR